MQARQVVNFIRPLTVSVDLTGFRHSLSSVFLRFEFDLLYIALQSSEKYIFIRSFSINELVGF